MESCINPPNDDENSGINERLDKLADDIKRLPPSRIKQLEDIIRSMSKRAVSIKEAAEMMGVSKDTIRRAIKSGHLEAFQMNQRGVWRITVDELDRFMKRGTN